MTGKSKFDIPVDALEAATEAYYNSWEWASSRWKVINPDTQKKYRKRIRLAIEAFIEKIQ